MNRSIFVALALLCCLAPFAYGQDDPNAFDRPTIFAKDSQDTVLLKHIWRRLGGVGDSTTTNGVMLSSPASTAFRNQAVGATPVLMKSSAGVVYGWNIINPNSSPVYVKLYDSAAPTVGTTIPVLVYAIPATGSFVIARNGFAHGTCLTAMSVACVTSYLDNSTTAPTTGVFVQAGVSQ